MVVKIIDLDKDEVIVEYAVMDDIDETYDGACEEAFYPVTTPSYHALLALKEKDVIRGEKDTVYNVMSGAELDLVEECYVIYVEKYAPARRSKSGGGSNKKRKGLLRK